MRKDLENKKKENYNNGGGKMTKDLVDKIIDYENEFIEDLNEIKSLILLFKDNYNNQELSDDLDYLFYKVDDLLKYL
jgi:hypothetical protein